MSRIAESSAERITSLRELIARIDENDSLESLSFLQAADEKLERAAVKLSIVGQVKAGKSTLINALAEIGDLLPTEVNPWTAVITNLHFGHALRTSNSAQFTMFSTDEWARMVEGDAETRRLAEEFLPGFDSGILQQQVEEMQERARKQLGDMYSHLLGKVHNFRSVTREVLDRYVCAGVESDESGDGDKIGKLASITKSADIYLDAGPFCLPITVTDTPGINDPFLVRDEITTQFIKTADMSVVAISAHQPLNAADIALLRMLSRTASKKVIVFVNRFDELGRAATEMPDILDSLRERLGSEVSDGQFELCAGSALWGHIAVQGTEAELAEAMASEAFRALDNAGAVPKNRSDRERLAAASGLDQLRAVLSAAIDDGPVLDLTTDVAGQVAVGIGLVRRQIEDRIKQEQAVLEGDPKAIRGAIQSKLQARRRELADLLKDVKGTFPSEIAKLDSAKEEDSFGPKINETIAFCIAEQCQTLRAAMARGATAGTWRFDYKQMRSIVDEKMLTHYQAARDRLDSRIGDFAITLNAKIGPTLGALNFGTMAAALPGKDLLPGFKPQTEFVEIDLSRSNGWKFWKSKQMDADEAMEALALVVRAETKAAAAETAEALAIGIAGRRAAAKVGLAEAVETVSRVVEKNIATLDSEIANLMRGGKNAEVDAFIAQRRSTVAALQSELRDLNSLSHALDNYVRDPGTKATAA